MSRSIFWVMTWLIFAPVLLPAATLDSVVAVVNDDVIMQSELDHEMSRIKQEMRSRENAPVPNPDLLQRQVIEQMILDRIQLQYAEITGISVSDTDVDKALAQVAAQNQLTPSALLIALQNEGIDLDYYRQNLHNQLVIRKLIEREVSSRINVTDQEVELKLETTPATAKTPSRYRLSHILLKAPENASQSEIESAERNADEAYTALQQGTEFASVARQYSEAADAVDGGSLGWMSTDQLPDLFIEQLSELDAGEITPVFKSANGFHILLLEESQGGTASLQQYRVEHILLRADDDDEKIIKEKTADLREQIIQGEDFAAIAEAHSQDLNSRLKGGDLGWINPGEIEPEIEQAIQALSVGVISQPVRTRYGYHLFRVKDKRAVSASQQREKNRIRQQIFAQKSDDFYQRWLQRLRNEAYIDNRLTNEF